MSERIVRQVSEPELAAALEACPFRSALMAYTPTSLTAGEWTAARIEVLRAVCRAKPTTEFMASDDLSRLCGFLASAPDWDHNNPPDIAALINERSITQHDRRLADRGLSVSSRHQARARLRRISRALRGGDPGLRRRWSGRTAAYILHPDQLGDFIRMAATPNQPNPWALALCAQIGSGLPASVAANLEPEQLDPVAGTINCDGRILGVLTDTAGAIAAAQAQLRVATPGDTSGLLADALSRPLWLLVHLRAGTPLSVVNLSSAVGTGRSLRRHELECLLPHLEFPRLDNLTAIVGQGLVGTLGADSLAAIRALKATLTVVGPEVQTHMQSTPQSKPASRPQRASRAAALRAAKQAMAESRERRDPLGLDTALSDMPGWPSLAESVRRHIENYWPRRVDSQEWAQVEPIAKRLLVLRLTELAVATEATAKRKINVIGSHLAPYLVWCRRHLEHRNIHELALAILEETSLDRYTNEGLVTEPRGTVATRRSEIRGALRSARPGLHPPKLTYRPVRPPYTAAEAAYHVRLARNQPTLARRRGLAFIVAAGYGAGLDGRDMASVRACDVFTLKLPDGDVAALIRVGGERPRTVVVRQEYTELLLHAVRLHHAENRGRRSVLLGAKPGRRNVTTPVLERLVTATGSEVEIEVPRLRSTWLVAHMSAPVPLGVLLSAAGLRSARALVDLLPYTATPEEDQCVEMLRARPGLLALTSQVTHEEGMA